MERHRQRWSDLPPPHQHRSELYPLPRMCIADPLPSTVGVYPSFLLLLLLALLLDGR